MALLGRALWDGPAFAGEARDHVLAAMRQAAAGHYSRREVLHQRADGSTAIHDFSVSPILNADGDVVMLVPEGRDITDLKRVERELRESEQKLSAILQNTSFLIGLCETDGTLVLANRAVQTGLGFEESELIGQKFWDTPIWPTDEVRTQARNAMNQAAAGTYARQELPHRRSDGSTSTYDFSVSPIRDADGNVVMLVPEGRDISELKRIEQVLRESEQRYRQLVDDLSDEYVIYSHTPDGTYTYASPSMLRLMGVEEADVIGRNWQDVVAPIINDETAALAAFEQVIAGTIPEPFEMGVSLPRDSKKRKHCSRRVLPQPAISFPESQLWAIQINIPFHVVS